MATSTETPADFRAAFAALPEKEQRRYLKACSPVKLAVVRWVLQARPEQLAPTTDWRVWYIQTGRGWGKNRTASEDLKARVLDNQVGRAALIGATAADARDTVIEGPSGVLNLDWPEGWQPDFQPSRRRVVWPNGALAFAYSADEPDRLRGPQHDYALCDEAGHWRYGRETWDNLEMGLRVGEHPRAVVTSTPRPVALVRHILSLPDVAVTRGHTLENSANLPQSTLDTLMAQYGDTRLGRQELGGELLEDVPGALWQRGNIEANRIPKAPGDMGRVIIGVDPSGASGDDEGHDEIGIVVVGQRDERFYPLEDASLRASPLEWARRVAELYERYSADRVVAEVNYGGAMVEHTLRSVAPDISYKPVTASRGKRVRAEPVAAKYEQGLVHHVGTMPALEDEMCNWTPESDESPNRMDALVWAISAMMTQGRFRMEVM